MMYMCVNFVLSILMSFCCNIYIRHNPSPCLGLSMSILTSKVWLLIFELLIYWMLVIFVLYICFFLLLIFFIPIKNYIMSIIFICLQFLPDSPPQFLMTLRLWHLLAAAKMMLIRSIRKKYIGGWVNEATELLSSNVLVDLDIVSILIFRCASVLEVVCVKY